MTEDPIAIFDYIFRFTHPNIYYDIIIIIICWAHSFFFHSQHTPKIVICNTRHMLVGTHNHHHHNAPNPPHIGGGDGFGVTWAGTTRFLRWIYRDGDDVRKGPAATSNQEASENLHKSVLPHRTPERTQKIHFHIPVRLCDPAQENNNIYNTNPNGLI